MTMTKPLMAVLASIFVSACATSPMATPSWLSDPGDGVVASCGFNIKGRYYQEECARTRAREQLAARRGVTVNSESVLKERVHNDRSSVTLTKETQEEVAAVTIRARERGSWYDAQRDLFYVWMEEH